MANQEVKVFFKVEGLDGYISDLGDLQNALGQAETATKELAETQGNLENNFDDLDSKLSTLEGGVKVLAGSVEIAAGALGALGIENEFFEAVEENVINIIALAEGAINVSEGFKLLAQNQKLATIAQRAFNIAANANPYVLLASALVAAGGALLIWKMNAEDAVPPTEELASEVERLSDARNATDIDKIIDRIDALRKAAFGDDRSEVDNAIDLVAETTAAIEASAERENQLLREAAEVQDETFQERLRNSQNYSDERLAQEIERNQKILDDEETNEDTRLFLQKVQDALRTREAVRAEQDLQFQLTAKLESAIEARDKLIDDADQREADRREQRLRDEQKFRDKQLKILEGKQVEEIEQTDTTNRTLAQGTVDLGIEVGEAVEGLTSDQVDRITNITDNAEFALENLQNYTTTTFGVLSDLNTIFTKDDEKRNKRAFEVAKKAQLAQAIVAGALAVNKAFASQLIPGDPTSLPRAIGAAAIAGIQTAAQIATIARQQYENPSPDGGGGGNPAASINYNFDQNAGPAITPGQGPTGGGAPTQTYVLASDVTSAQEAQAQIENLSRL